MPYPPESSWNLPPTAEQIRSINRAGRILGKEEITERNMPSTRWQARELMMEWWAEVRDKPRVKSALILMSNPGNLQKMRGELIRLKTDIEKEAPELETMYREAAEATVAAAKNCDISMTLDNYDFVGDIRNMLEKRLSSAEFFDQFPNIVEKTGSIEELIQGAVIEALIENCQCQIPREEEE